MPHLMQKLLLASNNRHKIKEIRQILDLENFEIIDLSSFPDIKPVIEDQDTLSGNALKKAFEIFRQTDILTLADDSGLMVDYLLGAPGVYSARYSGEKATYADNNKKLLLELKGVPPRKRTARFKCCIAIVGKNVKEVVEGFVEGKILFEPRGANGFGYDPLFLPGGFSRSYAELTDEEKNKISHRSEALIKAKEILRKL
jgi:XTP/dITP diphosphohydrolase